MNREGFGIRKILILKWIVLGSVLTWAYKSTLLSTLVTIRYNKPIDTLADLDTSGLPLVIAEGSFYHKAIENEQSDIIKRIYSRSIAIQVTKQTEAKYAAMYYLCIVNHKKRLNFVSNFRAFKNLVVYAGSKAYFDAMLINKAHPSKETVMYVPTSFIVPRGSPLQDSNTLYITKIPHSDLSPSFQSAFRNDIMWLHDMGILEKLKYDIMRPPISIPYPKVRRDEPLILSQLGIVIIILAAGLCLSLPVFFCELMKGRGKKPLIRRDFTEPIEQQPTAHHID